MSRIKFIPGEKLAYIASTTAIAISHEFDLEDLNILSSFFSAIGDSIGIIASQKEAIKTLAENSKPTDNSDNSDNSKNSDNNEKNNTDKNKSKEEKENPDSKQPGND